MKYYENSELDHLFAGTDVGVYYYNNNLNEWSAFNDSLPLSMVTDLEINYANSKLVASTFGRGMWQTDLPGCEDTATVVIRSDTTWDKTTTVCQNVEIDSGAVLTIKSEVFILNEISFIVKSGGKLVIDSGCIRSGFNDLWQGIEVWGNPRLAQNPANQGIVTVKNGGTIRDAKVAIYAGKSTTTGGPASNNGGGIVYADEAIFANNNSAIIFDPYNDYNISNISNSQFINEKHPYNYADLEQFIRFNSITGIKIEGTIFENEDYSSGGFGNIYGIGIYSINSQIFIREDYYGSLPSQDTSLCSFMGLEYGIKALATTPSKTITIDSCEFIQNKSNIYLGGISYATVRRNHFELSSGDTIFVTDTVSGIYLDECNGYQVEENKVFGNVIESGGGYTWVGIGVVINNSGPYPNEIYNNYFEDCYVGTIAQNKNRDRDGINGLQILCNDYVNCEYDIAVTADDNGNEIGIKKDQGSDATITTAPAGNTFSYTWESDSSDYANACNDIVYWFHAEYNNDHIIPVERNASVDTASNYQNPLEYSKDQSCPSNIASSGGGISGYKSSMIINEQKADSVNNLLAILIDGGDTDILNSEVQSSWPDEALELYNSLLNESPYLSDTVLVSAVNKENVLSSVLVTDILVANPHSAKSDTIMDAIDERINQLSENQLAEIDEGKAIISAKEIQESHISFFNAERKKALDNIIRYFKNDTISDSPVDSIVLYLNFEQKLSSRYQLAFEYLSSGDSLNMESALSSIPDVFLLTDNQLEQHQLYQAYIHILCNMQQNGEFVFEPDSLVTDSLYSLYSTSTGRLHTYLKNILCAFDTLAYQEPYIFPQEGYKSYNLTTKPVVQENFNTFMKLYPNPAGDYVIVEYGLEGPIEHAGIYIYSIEGKPLKDILLYNSSDYVIIDTGKFTNGAYIFSIINKDQILETKRLIIFH